MAELDHNNKLRLPSIYAPGEKIAARSLQSKKLQHVAGRWAAKEAVIKAHRHRRLFMSEISIVAESEAASESIYALVDPPSRSVLIHEDAAKIRGLLGYGDKESNICRLSGGFGPYLYGTVRDGKFVETVPSQSERFFKRRLRIQAEERQMAQVSISHDGDYATAVCIALDEPFVRKDEQSFIIDDGSGDSLHEPEWGDTGWLMSQDELELALAHDGMT